MTKDQANAIARGILHHPATLSALEIRVMGEDKERDRDFLTRLNVIESNIEDLILEDEAMR